MTQKEFQAVFREQVRQCEGLLIQKAKEYTGDNPDRLSAFKAAAAIQDSTPQRALAGMMAKHIISIYDMCYTDRKLLSWLSGRKRSLTALTICFY